MKKAILIALSVFLLLILLLYVFLYPRLAIITGYNAKNVCSCVFVSGFTQEKAEREDLGFGPLNQANNIIDYEKRTVSSTVFGLQKKKAFYREGFGCTLIKNNETEVNHSITKSGQVNFPIDSSEVSITRTETDDQYNLNPALTYAFAETDPGHPKNTRAVIILKNGNIVAERYASGTDHQTALLGWSMAKSITSLLAGILHKEGKFDLHEPVPVNQWKNNNREFISYSNLLQMNSGLEWEEDYSKVSDATLMLFDSDSMGYFAASQPLEFEPGQNWEYSSGSSNILSWSLARFFPSRKDYHEFPYKSLFRKIGAETMLMETDAAGYFVGSSYCFGSARDWAKVGQLCLQEGQWNGNQIIDSSWFKFIKEPAMDSEGKYGGQFWLNYSGSHPDCPRDMFYMDGFHGQRVFIIPSKNLVIVRMGLTYTSGDFNFNEWVKDIIESTE